MEIRAISQSVAGSKPAISKAPMATFRPPEIAGDVYVIKPMSNAKASQIALYQEYALLPLREEKQTLCGIDCYV